MKMKYKPILTGEDFHSLISKHNEGIRLLEKLENANNPDHETYRSLLHNLMFLVARLYSHVEILEQEKNQ
jgi:hypothetical protein